MVIHQRTPQWYARWVRITNGLHWLSLILLWSPVLAQASWTWVLSLWSASFMVRALYARLCDHVDERMTAALEELQAWHSENQP